VAQHDDFGSQLRAIPAEPAKDLKEATKSSVEKGEGHGLGILPLPQASTKVLVPGALFTNTDSLHDLAG
jgi:hypothetical protein